MNTLEIRPAEGGKDAKLLVSVLAECYTKFLSKENVKFS